MQPKPCGCFAAVYAVSQDWVSQGRQRAADLVKHPGADPDGQIGGLVLVVRAQNLSPGGERFPAQGALGFWGDDEHALGAFAGVAEARLIERRRWRRPEGSNPRTVGFFHLLGFPDSPRPLEGPGGLCKQKDAAGFAV